LLKVDGIDVFYGDLQILWDVSFDIKQNEIVGLLGSNASGKTTLVKTLSGLIHPKKGTISFLDERIDSLDPHQIVDSGIIQIPEGKLLFPYMTVQENLDVGSYSRRARKDKDQNLEFVFDLFPRLNERKKQLAGTLSGGEQQMLAIGRGLMASPKFLIFDEPSLGLAPLLVSAVFDVVKKIGDKGMTILLIEQNVNQTLDCVQRGYVIENGKIVIEGSSEELKNNPHVKKTYLGL
jgi:branched-chain amino acid transport system ATP-binding protein